MSSKRLSLRFNLNNPGDLAAWEYLHRLDGDSINKEIISMINASKQNNDLRELLRQTITVAMQGIAFDTLSGLGKYEVVAVFKFNTNRESFKYNEYTLMDEAQFAEFMENVRARQLYDTGVTAEYGDRLLTLSTCEYTYPNGRFVVVAKKV